MKRVFASNQHLAERSAERGAGWVTAFETTVLERTPEGVWFDCDAAAVVARRFEKKWWPTTAKMLASLARPEDRGLGDVVQRVAGKFGGERFKQMYKQLTGRDCNCSSRQEKLNKLFPLK